MVVIDNDDILSAKQFIVLGFHYVVQAVRIDDAVAFALAMIWEHAFNGKNSSLINGGNDYLSETMQTFGHVAATDQNNLGQILSLVIDPADVQDVVFNFMIFRLDDRVVGEHLVKTTVLVERFAVSIIFARRPEIPVQGIVDTDGITDINPPEQSKPRKVNFSGIGVDSDIPESWIIKVINDEVMECAFGRIIKVTLALE